MDSSSEIFAFAWSDTGQRMESHAITVSIPTSNEEYHQINNVQTNTFRASLPLSFSVSDVTTSFLPTLKSHLRDYRSREWAV